MAIANRHPADELADIRNDLKRLKSREAFLLNGLVNDRFPRIGNDVVAQVSPFKKRVFLREKLPPHILEDETFWRTDIVKDVQLAPAPGAAGDIVRFRRAGISPASTWADRPSDLQPHG